LNKKLLLYFFLLLLTANLFAYIAIYYKLQVNLFNSDNYLNKKKSFFLENPINKFIHPFFGQLDLNNYQSNENNLTNEKLFFEISENENKKNYETLKILLLGGSVGINFSDNADQNFNSKKNISEKNSYSILAKKFEKYFPEKNIKFYNASIRSSKQPQQLFKLYYLYLLGMEFDVVINIDGPLDIAYPYLKNFYLKDEAIYPRRYSDELINLAKDVSCIDKNNNEVFRNSYIPIFELYSLLKIRDCHKKYMSRGGIKAPWKKFTTVKEKNIEDVINTSYNIWRNSTLSIEDFSKQKNFFYLHVIFPSQHVIGSKLLSEEEKNYFLNNEYSSIISKYFERNINFTNIKITNFLDLKYIFKNVNETTYRDSCCRFNNYGMNLISDEIVKYIREKMLIK
jgi:hypothetical protein